MSDNLDEIDPTSLLTYPSTEMNQMPSLNVTSIIDRIAQSLAQSAQSPENFLTFYTQSQTNSTIGSQSREDSNESLSQEQTTIEIQDNAESSQCIDLTKEQDDVLVISDSPVNNRNNRRNARKTIRQRPQLNDASDEIEVISSRIRRPNANETIVIDDDRTETQSEIIPAQAPSSSNDNDIVQICSPSKRLKTQPVINPISNPNELVEDDRIPKCPLCLENLSELKEKNRKLVATPCGHVMCNKCIDDYFKSSGAGAKSVLCPTCRTKLTKSKMITLFI